MQEMLDRYGTGILITDVTIQDAQPPEQVQAAFDDAVKASQDRERQINEGQAYANDVVPKARGAAARLRRRPRLSHAGLETRRATRRASAVLTEYNKAPAVTRDRMYLETMQQIFSNTTKVMVDVRSGNPLLYLPLDKLIQQAADRTPRRSGRRAERAGR